jgi:REP element-mobilizing transposase RayT
MLAFLSGLCQSVPMPFTIPDEPNPGLNRVRHQLRADGVKDVVNPLRSGIHNRGYLPHVKREGAAYFVTFRLADSLPREMLLQFEQEKVSAKRQLAEEGSVIDPTGEIARDFQRKLEHCLDRGMGVCHLRREEVAGMLADVLRHFHQQRYLLQEWVIMPNHVHAIVWPMPSHLLGDIVKSWKQFSSRQAMQIIGLGKGPFWQREYFDHWIRTEEEKSRIARYIRNNPVNAGLCARPEDWRWSSAYNYAKAA